MVTTPLHHLIESYFNLSVGEAPLQAAIFTGAESLLIRGTGSGAHENALSILNRTPRWRVLLR